ncbi:MAG: AmmeMemoRadiSam system protein B [Patescibacteria group bacterium]|jgi:AmmeMemoRadiSam system protein B
MSLVFSSIVPHPPLIIPSVGKENAALLKKTSESYKKLEEDLYASQPETLIIISPHGCIQENSFSLNQSPEFTANMEGFGDFSTKLTVSGNIMLAHKIRERLETKAPLQMISEEKLDYGASVPLLQLVPHLPKIKIIPIYYSGQNLEANYLFGRLLKKEILRTKERVAVVASGDLSHRLSKNSPAGYSPKGKKFDKELIELLLTGKTQEIIKMDEKFIHEACECGLKSIAILLGILDGMKCRPIELSYESPFGIGYLAMQFKF